MTAIQVQFVNGFRASQHGNTHEHPPAPVRLVYALVSVHKEQPDDIDERNAIEWLEAQGPPSIHCPEPSFNDPEMHWVPVADKLMPINRIALFKTKDWRNKRVFPVVHYATPFVHFSWPADAGKHAPALRRLTERIRTLGHSTSFVIVRLVDETPAPNWVPDKDGTQVLRCAAPGLLASLEEDFQRTFPNGVRGGKPYDLAYEPVTYRETSRPARVEPPATDVWSPNWFVLEFDRKVQEPLDRSLALAQGLRNALLANGPQPNPVWLSGHEPNGEPTREPHIALIPLADVGRPYATGFIRGFAVLAPASLSSTQRLILRNTLKDISYIRRTSPTNKDGYLDVPAKLSDNQRYPLQRSLWQDASETWTTVTPVVLDRHGDEMNVLRRAAEHVGLPLPCKVGITKTPLMTGTDHACSFQRHERHNQRQLVHATIVFPTKVKGPVILGSGRFYGYGLFRPIQAS